MVARPFAAAPEFVNLLSGRPPMRSLFPAFVTLLVAAPSFAQSERTLEQIPDLRSLPDATERLQRDIDNGGGNLLLADKVTRITRPLVFDLKRHGAISVRATGGATLIMDGPGPAILLRGTHEGTASPKSFRPETWHQRMPVVSGIEILGAHPEADGVELQGTVGAILEQLSIRWCRHGIHLTVRNRNVIVSQCHLYENSGVGLYLDDVNLHQINVGDSHVSYNRQGGIVVRDGNVRNLQVTGCDIEGNMPEDETPTTTANILIDVSGTPDDKSRSVAEVAITGCTIQHAANYSGSQDKTVAPGGANIRLAGKAVWPIDSVTITGNVLSDTTTNIDMYHCNDIVVASNNFFAPRPANLNVRECRRVVVSGNTFHPRQFVRPGTITFTDSADCIVSNNVLHSLATDQGSLILQNCSGFTLSGLNLSDCGSGIRLRETSDTLISRCHVMRTADGFPDIDIDATNQNIHLTANVFSGEQIVEETALAVSADAAAGR